MLASEALSWDGGSRPAGHNGWRNGGRTRGADRWPI
jgi:hypothetical protein